MSPHDEATPLARRVFTGAAWTVASTMLLRVGNIAIMALIARVLAPAEFGVFAVALAVHVVVSSLAELGMGSAIAKAPEEPADIAPTVTALAIMISGTLAVAMAAFAGPLASALGSPAAAGPIRVLSISLLLTGIFAVPGAQLVREYRQEKLFLANAVGFVPANVVLIGLALAGGGATSFAWSRVVGQLAVGLVMVASLQRRYRPGLNRRLVVGLLAFGLPLALANLVNWALLNADYLVVARFLSEADVGAYMLAFSIAGWSTAVLGAVLNSLVVPTFARFAAASGTIRGALRTSLGIVAIVSLPIGAVTFALADPLVATVFGAQWAESVPALRVLVLYGVMFSFSLLLVNALVATARTAALLVVQLIWICCLVPVMTWSVRWGVAGVAWAHVAVIATVVLPAYVVALRPQDRVAWREVVRELLPPAVGAVSAGLASAATSAVLPSDWLRFLVGGMAGVLTFVGVMAGPLRSRLPEFVRQRLESRPIATAQDRALLTAQRIAARMPSPLRRALQLMLPRTVRAVRSRHGVEVAEDWSIPLIGSGTLGADADGGGLLGAEPTTVPASARDLTPLTPLTCLLVTDSLDAGGMDAFVDFLARGLRSRGATVSVMIAADEPEQVDGRFAARLRADGIQVTRAEAPTVAAQIERADPDCISLHGAPDWVVDAAASRDVPVVETLHGMHTLDDRRRLRARSRHLAAIVAVSRHVKDEYLEWVPRFDRDRLVVVPNGVPSRRRPESVRLSTRTALGLTGEFVFVSLGRYCLQKNTFGLVASFDMVAEAVPDAHLVVAGRVDDAAYFAQVVARRDRSPFRDRIHLRGHAGAPSALLAASDAFVLDSFFEGWSLASTEALTAGLPVVLAEVGGAAEQLAWAEPPGFMVANPLGDHAGVSWEGIASARFRPHANSAALAAAMIDVAGQRHHWAQRRDAIAREAEVRFTPDVCLERHIEVLMAVTGRQGRTGTTRPAPITERGSDLVR